MKETQITDNINYVEISQITEGLEGFIFIAKTGTIYHMKRIGENNNIVSPDAIKKWMINAQGKKNNTLYFDAEEHVFVYSFKEDFQIAQSKIDAFEIDKVMVNWMRDAYNKHIESLYPKQHFAKSRV